ncbi:MAG: 5,10-methylenetetrahydromethanopterin reductase [Candidatus Thorarchaeota archaeon]
MHFAVEFVPQEAYWQTTALGILAEKYGFDFCWITDHFNNRSVYVILSLLANYTDRIMLGPGVTNPYLINPVQTASTLMSLDNLSGGRAILGIGAGDMITLNLLGIERTKPLTAVKESVHIFRTLFDSGKINEFKGTVFTVEKAKVAFEKTGKIPIYIGAQGPKMLQLAGAKGQGVLVNASHPRDFEFALKQIKKGVEEEQRKISEIDVAAYASVSVAEKIEKATKAAVPVVAFIVAGSPPVVLERHGISVESVKPISDGLSKGDFPGAFAAVTETMLDAFCIRGTPVECTEKIAALQKTGITQFVLGSPIGPKKRQAMELASKEILPHFH